MSSKTESERSSFHRRQMESLPTLIAGVDPDPPVLLCPGIEKFDQVICTELRLKGWPATGKSTQEREANPPAPIKGAVLARKLANGNDLATDEIELLAKRIAWLQRNWFRWPARDGYTALAVSKKKSQASRNTVEAVDKTSVSGPSNTLTTAAKLAEHETGMLPYIDPTSAVSAPEIGELDEVDTAVVQDSPALVSADRTDESNTAAVADNISVNGPTRHAQATDLATVADNCDAALAALGRGADDDNSVSYKDYVKTVGKGETGGTKDRFISLRTSHIKSVEGDKVRKLLFAIFYREPNNEIERRARALAADKPQLFAALSGIWSTREDVREAFTKLGLDADA